MKHREWGAAFTKAIQDIFGCKVSLKGPIGAIQGKGCILPGQ